MLGFPNCICNEVRARDFICSEEFTVSGKTHMLTRKSRATNSARNYFVLLVESVFVLVSQSRLGTRSLNFVGHMIRFESGPRSFTELRFLSSYVHSRSYYLLTFRKQQAVLCESNKKGKKNRRCFLMWAQGPTVSWYAH